MKSKELKNYNLPDNRMYNNAIEAKPNILLICVMILGVILIAFRRYLIGGVISAFALACLLFLPNRKLIEFYDDHMILYNKARKDECTIIYYEDVKSWEYKTKVSMDELVLNLIDGSVQKIDGFSKTEFEKKINVYLKDKKIVQEKKIYKKNYFKKKND